MKSRELKALIDQYDPTGEMDVCSGNVGITSVKVSVATENGWYQIVDLNNRIPSAKYVGQGTKLVLNTTSIPDIIRDYPTMKIEIIGKDAHGIRNQMIEGWRGFRLKDEDVHKDDPEDEDDDFIEDEDDEDQ